MSSKARTAGIVSGVVVVAVIVVAVIVYGILLATDRPAPSTPASASFTASPSPTRNPTVSASAVPTKTAAKDAPQPAPSSRHPLIDAARAVDIAPYGNAERATFFTPGHQAFCMLDRDGVQCDLAYRLAYHAGDGTQPCEAGERINDGASLDGQGARFGVCRSDMPLRDLCPHVKPGDAEAKDCADYNRTPQLRAGTRVTLGDYTCAAGPAGAVECITEQHGFLVDPRHYALH